LATFFGATVVHFLRAPSALQSVAIEAYQRLKVQVGTVQQELLDTKRSLDTLQQPKLIGSIQLSGSGTQTNRKDGRARTIVFVAMTIKNVGADSIIEGWPLRIQGNGLNILVN